MNFFTNYKLNQKLKTHPRGVIVILTGAGISAESGIQTFRGAGGLWNGIAIEDVCRPESFINNPERVLQFYNQRRNYLLALGVNPNSGHNSLSALEQSLPDVYLITQNVDNLHEKAGTKNIYHIHGQLFKNKCHDCKYITYSENKIPFPNQCEKCKNYNCLRPDVVFFKEAPYHMKEVESLINMAQIFIAVGTSGQVYPAAGLVKQAKKMGALTIEVNTAPTENNFFDFKLKGKATEILPKLVQQLLHYYK